MRLDKFLAHTTGYSRNDVKKFIKKKLVTVNGEVAKSANIKVNAEVDAVMLGEDELFYEQYVYLMMNKPAGYLSATQDPEPTVIDLLDDYYLKFDVSIAGRLDKDTEGLLLLTNDGKFIHNIIHPKKKMAKRYVAQIEGELTAEGIARLEAGVEIKDGKDVLFTTLPATVRQLEADEVEISIVEGKFHQVKRMFEAVGCRVTYLKRLAIGSLVLDEGLDLGEYRPLTEAELEGLMG